MQDQSSPKNPGDVSSLTDSFRLHRHHPEWLKTPTGEDRGYIDAQGLKELWFHTGTICNLQCPFCLEGSKPGDDRLNRLTLADARPFIQEALSLGVEQFSFTGGEPFVVKDIIRILDECLTYRPCLVLTNATDPLERRWEEILPLREKPHALRFRVSLDYPDPERHNAGRGPGTFQKALANSARLYQAGFGVSIARQESPHEDPEAVEKAYGVWFRSAGLPEDTRIVSFPDFLPPGSLAEVPHITSACLTQYHTSETRAQFMCAFSRMVIKRSGQMTVTACTLVDDDPDYDLASTLTESLRVRVMLKHHRCYSCFACGASCSER